MNKTVKFCDACGEIAVKVVEFGGFVAVVNGTRREVNKLVECCSQQCVTSVVAGMLRDVETAATARPDCHAIGRGDA